MIISLNFKEFFRPLGLGKEKFFENLDKMPFDELVKKYTYTPSIFKRILWKVKRVVKCCSFIVKWDCQVNLTRCKGTLANMSRILDSVSKRKRR